ncbi:hypothetical protein NV391_06785 [Companilactobacillus crustorum]|uniref:hypothetical protein n=1 Tax=Companilactobacillus crustorum TaxID=392416 RepID=UPI00237E8F3F|nr:hypothetical protein [Companilactobacillus crustorum]WDT64699.1 hypothetical protein NV391_06785 [Companilactobacillus crustorum]
MLFYHSTSSKNKNKIIKSSMIVPTKFDITKYLDVILPNFDGTLKVPEIVKGQRMVPYLGEGVYCFDNYNSAASYQVNNDVVTIEYDDKCEKIDLDNPIFLIKLDNYLNEEFDDELNKKFLDEDVKLGYKVLKNTILYYIYDEKNFEKVFPQMFAIIIFLLYDFRNKEEPDVFFRKFSVCDSPYFVIKNERKIESLC